jgi:transcriptional regulator with XRE-family HTH domain
MSGKPVLLPKHRRMMTDFGERLKLARLRRRLSAEMVAERAGMSRATLHKIEGGAPSVAMGHYFSVMRVLGLETEFLQLAEDDVFGRRLQDSALITKRRAPKRKARDDN